MNYKEIMARIVSKEQAQQIMITFKSLVKHDQNGGVYLKNYEFNSALLKAFAVHGIDLGNGITGGTIEAVITRLERKSKIEF